MTIRAAVRAAFEAVPPPSKDQERSDTIAYLDAALDAVYRLTPAIKGYWLDPQARIVLTMYGTLLDLGRAVALLSRERPSVAVPTIVRQGLDAFLDIYLCISSPNYSQRLELSDGMVWDKLLQSARAGNIYLTSISEHFALREYHHGIQAAIAKAKADGLKSAPQGEDKFIEADRREDYVVWRILSAAVHNNITHIYGRHFEIQPDRPPSEVILEPVNVPFEVPAIDHMARLIVEATVLIHGKFGESTPDFQALEMQSIGNALRREPVRRPTDVHASPRLIFGGDHISLSSDSGSTLST